MARPMPMVKGWLEAIFWLAMLGLVVLAGGQIYDRMKAITSRKL